MEHRKRHGVVEKQAWISPTFRIDRVFLSCPPQQPFTFLVQMNPQGQTCHAHLLQQCELVKFQPQVLLTEPFAFPMIDHPTWAIIYVPSHCPCAKFCNPEPSYLWGATSSIASPYDPNCDPRVHDEQWATYDENAPFFRRTEWTKTGDQALSPAWSGCCNGKDGRTVCWCVFEWLCWCQMPCAWVQGYSSNIDRNWQACRLFSEKYFGYAKQWPSSRNIPWQSVFWRWGWSPQISFGKFSRVFPSTMSGRPHPNRGRVFKVFACQVPTNGLFAIEARSICNLHSWYDTNDFKIKNGIVCLFFIHRCIFPAHDLFICYGHVDVKDSI